MPPGLSTALCTRAQVKWPETPALGYFETLEALDCKGFQQNVNPNLETCSPKAETVS